MSEQKITESELLRLVNDINFERIDLGLKSANIFEVLQVSRQEIRHSNFLAWLLNPNENHGLNELVLVRFLREVFSDQRAKNISGLDADSLDFQKVEIKREWQNIDLVLLIDNVVVAIENKVDSKEHSNQLQKYQKIIESNFKGFKKVFVYLTPHGEPAKMDHEVYIEYSYAQFTDILERILDVHQSTIGEKALVYIKDYIQTLKRTIMQNDELNSLAERLYKNHRETLDFIFENRPDSEHHVRKLFHQKIEKSGWILGSVHKGFARFLTPDLNSIIPRYNFSNGWPNKEAFLFEIDFYWYKKDLVFKSIISPGDEEVMNTLASIISKVDGAIKPMGKKWICHFIIKSKFDMDKISELTDEEIFERFDQMWPAIETVVQKVEHAILEDGRMTEIAKNHNTK
jgi:hypothetical protein